jgi:hypothetical protein
VRRDPAPQRNAPADGRRVFYPSSSRCTSCGEPAPRGRALCDECQFWASARAVAFEALDRLKRRERLR